MSSPETKPAQSFAGFVSQKIIVYFVERSQDPLCNCVMYFEVWIDLFRPEAITDMKVPYHQDDERIINLDLMGSWPIDA